jgi:hypothetical protein
MNTSARVLGKRRPGVGRAAKARAGAEQEDEEVAIDEKPKSVYEVITRQMLEQVRADVGEVKGRVNTLLWLVIGALVVELVMRIFR